MSNLKRLSVPALVKEARRELARRSLEHFSTYIKPDYQVNWHHRVLCRYLDQFVEGAIRRLLVFMPPRHGKSQLVSRHLPAYILGRYPDTSIIASSYSADLASRMNRDVQRIIDDERYVALFPDTRLSGSNVRTVAQGTYLRNSDIFEVVGRRGVYRSTGVGGGITGMGFHRGIIDDPIKNREEANSPTIREKLWDWYTSVFYTRQEKDAGILLTVTRWHEDDLAGRLLRQMTSEGGEQWVVVDFPAIAEAKKHPDDPRQTGEALWPDKYDVNQLRQIEQMLGAYDWNALYQQHPIPASGGLFKREKFNQITDWPKTADGKYVDVTRLVRFWDLALSSKTSADYTVGVLMGLTKFGRLIILDVQRFQAEWDDVPNKIKDVALMDGPGVQVGVETAFFQTRAVQNLLKMPQLRQYVIKGYPPDKDKYTRALPFAARVGADMVDVLKRGWTESYLDELCAFPLGAHDDQVDATSGAYTMLDTKVITGEARSY